ncbi:CdaR family protein [Salipaludibacillus aurantiacus]|uniref:YbbR domain-containing protein n=1 Tax=Salipaludibacillus aurantiacus TaxID=1601833 RepID=A0A1H9V1Z1_9BACI|nr:CdaR family protein [Salipaludibacillus aurantiacus]SES15830.1 YbbR domain-containing protein [Salipaludibacillus aurantiacus]
MDKLFNKSWFIKLTSLVIAVMLFLMVNMDNTTNQPGGIPGITDGSRILEEVDLNVYYDEDRYVLTEAPETVQVTLRGPQNILTLAQVTQPQQEVFVDLEGKEAGVHYERVQHRGFPTDLNLSIVPMTVRVTIQEKQTASFPVDVELVNEGEMEEGYVAGTPEAAPSTVEVTAAQGIIDQVASARAIVDMSGRATSFEEAVPVTFYDQNGNEMELTGDPAAVEVSVPVTSPNKSVPLRIGRNGDLPAGMAIDSISINPERVTIYGPVDVINNISFIDLPNLEVGDLSGGSSYELDVPVPDGVERVDPETVTIEVETADEESRTFSDFGIQVEGLGSSQTIQFLEPEDGQFDLVVNGSQGVLGRLERPDLRAEINVNGLSAGEHEAELEITGPQNLRFPQQDMTVNFIISENTSRSGGSSVQETETGDNMGPDENNENIDDNDNSDNVTPNTNIETEEDGETNEINDNEQIEETETDEENETDENNNTEETELFNIEEEEEDGDNQNTS